MIDIINLVAIESNMTLMVKKNDVWIFPGGKIQNGESWKACLYREIKEELPEVKIGFMREWGQFNGITPHTNRPVQVFCYMCEITGNPLIVGENDSISEARWISDPSTLNVSDISNKILESLFFNGLLQKEEK